MYQRTGNDFGLSQLNFLLLCVRVVSIGTEWRIWQTCAAHTLIQKISRSVLDVEVEYMLLIGSYSPLATDIEVRSVGGFTNDPNAAPPVKGSMATNAVESLSD